VLEVRGSVIESKKKVACGMNSFPRGSVFFNRDGSANSYNKTWQGYSRTTSKCTSLWLALWATNLTNFGNSVGHHDHSR
jgi:hypothetical protein